MAGEVLTIKHRCEDCAQAANEYGLGCKVNLLTPVILLTTGHETCPFFERCAPDVMTERIDKRAADRERNEANNRL